MLLVTMWVRKYGTTYPTKHRVDGREVSAALRTAVNAWASKVLAVTHAHRCEELSRKASWGVCCVGEVKGIGVCRRWWKGTRPKGWSRR